MDDPADMGLGAGPIERGGTGLVHGLQELAGAVLQGAGAIDHSVDALDKRAPGRKVGRPGDVEPDMAQRYVAFGRDAGHADNAGTCRMQAQATAAPMKPVTPTTRTV